MNNPARLTSSLLARKGEASPSRGFSPYEYEIIPLVDSLRPPVPDASTAVARPAQTELAPTGAKNVQPKTGKARVAMTLRLDHDRHRRLKVMAALQGRSAQDIMQSALDSYLGRMRTLPRFQNCECLQEQD